MPVALGKLIFRVTQPGMTGIIAVHGVVYLLLQVLYPRTDRKRLGGNLDTFFQAQEKKRTCCVTRRQNQAAAGNDAGIGYHTGYLTAMDLKILRCGMKTHFPAQGDDLPTNGNHHLPQYIGADVRFGGGQDRRRRTVCRQLLQHITAIAVVDARHQFTVGKGAGTAFAKLNVGVRIQF